MTDSADDATRLVSGAIGTFHVHPGHAFSGFRIVEGPGGDLVLAECVCGAVLDVADAVYEPCPACRGSGAACLRCGSSGLVVSHRSLRWRPARNSEVTTLQQETT